MLTLNELAKFVDPFIGEILGSRESDLSIYDIVAPRLFDQSDLTALAPGPTVNAALTRLVGLMTTTFGFGKNSSLHWEILESICSRIESEPDLRNRALTIRRAAAKAETLMEIHCARQILAESSLPSKVEDSMASLSRVFGAFPYVVNYKLLVESEEIVCRQLQPTGPVAFCGAGALPLTAIIWQLRSGNDVVMVEIDPATSSLIRQIIAYLDGLNVVDKKKFYVETIDAATLDPASFSTIIVASLVPNNALVSLAQSVAALEADGPLLVARSAVGLTRLLAYEAVDTQAIISSGLTHVGTVAPITQVSNELLKPSFVSIPAQQLLRAAPEVVLNTSEFYFHTR